MLQIILGAGGRRHVQHGVQRAVHRERLRNVVQDEAEARMCGKMRQVLLRPGEEIIDSDHVVAIRQQAVTHVRAYESGGSGN